MAARRGEQRAGDDGTAVMRAMLDFRARSGAVGDRLPYRLGAKVLVTPGSGVSDNRNCEMTNGGSAGRISALAV